MRENLAEPAIILRLKNTRFSSRFGAVLCVKILTKPSSPSEERALIDAEGRGDGIADWCGVETLQGERKLRIFACE